MRFVRPRVERFQGTRQFRRQHGRSVTETNRRYMIKVLDSGVFIDLSLSLKNCARESDPMVGSLSD